MARAEDRAAVKVEQVAEGLHRLSLPLGFDPGRVNVYVDVGPDGSATLFDAGTDDGPCRKALAAGLERLGVGLESIRDLVVTHAHVDHYGLAGWLDREAGAKPLMHRGETLILERHWRPEWWIPEYAAYMRRHGVEPELAERLAELEDWSYTLSPLEGFQGIEDGDEIQSASGRVWRVVHTPGHTSGHVALFSERERILIGGDHVLAVYSPHLRHVPGELTDPLAAYLAALRRVELLEPRLVLPGHGRAFGEIAPVAEGLRNGHAEVLSRVRRAIARPANAADVTRALHGDELPDFHLRLALPQTTVYMRHLEAAGEATAHLEGGVLHYVMHPAAGGSGGGRTPVGLEEAFAHE